MEAYLRKIGLRHLKHIVGICKKHVTSLAVYRHKLMLTLLERLQSIGIVAFNPASLVKAYRLPAALRTIFVQQTVLDDLELQLPDCSYYLPAIELIDEQLRHALIHKLLYTLIKLLCFHRVSVLYIFEHLRRETRQSLEMQFLAGSQSVADFEIASIGNAHDIAGVSLIDSTC